MRKQTDREYECPSAEMISMIGALRSLRCRSSPTIESQLSTRSFQSPSPAKVPRTRKDPETALPGVFVNFDESRERRSETPRQSLALTYFLPFFLYQPRDERHRKISNLRALDQGGYRKSVAQHAQHNDENDHDARETPQSIRRAVCNKTDRKK